ncbi:MAG: 5'-methylthioadenosine/S-adenosylhomocysteine nucleosidase [Acholeplasmataceae bacterium]|nr:5'-methylthioadenosine/S-adenosylhomocysteine nucleosidase [Acholeplasmataceae bacterium]
MILCCIAMEDEMKYIVNHRSFNTKLILTGIGKVNAASHLAESIARNHVEKIINLGFAGASNGYEVGDLVLVERASYHDFDLTMFGYEKGQVPGCPSYFQSDHELVEDVLKKYPHIKRGELFTGDYFMTHDLDHKVIVDMEGAALYQVAHAFNVPIISIKVISDIIGHGNTEAYDTFNAEHGAKLLEEVYSKLILEG